MTLEPRHTVSDLLLRVRGEFLEMPGLRLTEAQACRLFGLDADACTALLVALVEVKFLFRTNGGGFMLVDRPAPSNATLESHRWWIPAA